MEARGNGLKPKWKIIYICSRFSKGMEHNVDLVSRILERSIKNLEFSLDKSCFKLYKIMDRGYPQEHIFSPGRLVHDTHSRIDPVTNTREYFYRKILSYDSNRKVVLLSKEGSKNSRDQLDQLDREFTLKEIYGQPIGSYAIRAMNWDIDMW